MKIENDFLKALIDGALQKVLKTTDSKILKFLSFIKPKMLKDIKEKIYVM